jgi:glycosyltransferase involved in cell wall biosynthesis
MNLLMLSLDTETVEGKQGAFHSMLEVFHKYWDRIDVITPGVEEVRTTRLFDNVHLHPTQGGKTGRVKRIVAIGRRLREERDYGFMIAHDSGLFQSGRAAWRLFRMRPMPYISEIHHVPGCPRASNLREWVECRVTRLYLKRYARRHPYFRVNNVHETLPFLRAAGVPEERIRLVRSFFIDLEAYRPMDEEKVYDVVGCGRLVSNKGFPLTLEAVKRLKEKRPDVRAAIVGGGPLRSRLEGRVRDMGLSGNVVFLGRVPTSDDVARAYNRARTMVMSSYNEGGPRTTLEAMACGTPIVSTRVGLMHELVEDGVNGFLVDWNPVEIADRIERLLADDSLAKRMGEAGRRSVQPYRREDTIREYALGYHRLAEEWRGHADQGLLCAASL